MAREAVLTHAAVALLAALALLAAAALAQPVANSVDPPSWLPPIRVPASGSVYQTLHSAKVWSDSCTVSYYGPTSATVSWTNSTSVYLYPGWSALLFLTQSYSISDFAFRCALSSPTFIALKPRYQLPSGASGWIALIANATTLGSLSSCSVGASALGGTIVACIPVTGTGSTVEAGSWYNISYVSSFAVYLKSGTAGVLYIGSYIDVSKLVWLSGPPPASTGRRPVYQAVFNATGTYASALPQPSDAWRRPGYTLFLYGPAPPSSIQPAGSLTFWYILDAPANVTVRHAYADGSISAGVPAPPRSYVFDDKQPAWANFSSGGGWLKIVAPQQGEELKIAAPASGAVPVTFFINDYGQGYTHLIVYTPASRLAWRDEISSATRSAVAYLQPYGNYVLALRKPGEERVLGPVTVSQTQYTLTVLPQLQPAPPPSTAVVYYNSSLPGYVVDVSCASPPCTVTLVKKQATQPQLLAAEFTLTGAPLFSAKLTVTSSGATVAPHLYDWYFDGVDDYVFLGLLADNTGKPLSVYGWSAVTFASRLFLFNPKPLSYCGRPIYSGWHWATAPAAYLVTIPCASSWSTAQVGTVTVNPDGTLNYNLVDVTSFLRGKWGTVAAALTSSTFTVYAEGSLVKQLSITGTTLLSYDPDSNPTYAPRFKRWSLGAAADGSTDPVKAYAAFFALWRRALPSAEVAALQQYVVNATQLEAFFDPTWYNGTHYVSLTGGYVGKGYNGATRVPAYTAWLWVVQGLSGDGKLHFRFFPEGSYATVKCGSFSTSVSLGWDDVAVQVPLNTECEVTVYAGGATIAPHLFTWSFDGVDDYMVCGLQPAGSGAPFTVYGWPAITLEDYLFVPVVVSSAFKSTSMIGDAWTDYPSTRFVANPSFTYLYLAWRTRTSSGGAKDYAANLLSAAGKWMHAVRRFTVARELSFWLNGSRLAAYTVPSSEYTVLDWNPDAATYPFRYQRFVLGANVGGSEKMTVSYRYARIWSRELSDVEVQAFAAGSTVINATGLRLFIDASWCSGTTCFNLADTTMQCRMYNGVARLPANETWLWVVQGLPGDGKLHFRFFPEGSRATVWCGSTILDVQLGWSDVAVQVPAGEKCRVAVHVAPQPYILETASYTCGEARCRFTWITSDPFLEASVSDAKGYVYVARLTGGWALPQPPIPAFSPGELVGFLVGDFFSYAISAFLAAGPALLGLAAWFSARRGLALIGAGASMMLGAALFAGNDPRLHVIAATMIFFGALVQLGEKR